MIPNHGLNRLIFLLALLLPSTFSDSSNDRLALINLRSTVRGQTLRWNTTNDDPCTWKGVGCDVETRRVISLRLPGDGLAGNLSLTYVGNLTELQVLSLRSNALSGPIPDGLASCKNLRYLHLQGNRFSGEVPGWFFGLKNLRHVNLGFNGLSGALPPELNDLTNLRVLYLESNRFAGPLPDLSGLTGLRRFNVSFNELVGGSIPPSLAGFPSGSFEGTSLCGGNFSAPCPRNGSRGNNRKLSRGAVAGIAAAGSIVALILIVVVALLIYRRKRSTETVLPRTERSASRREISITAHGNNNINQFSKAQQPITATEKDKESTLSTSNSRRIHAKERLEHDGLVFFGDSSSKAFTLQELLMASAQIMHRGATGTAYKAYLDADGEREVIVKRLKNVYLPESTFRHKIEVLGSLEHENLLPLIGYFYGRDEHLLIYKSLPRVITLFELLHGNNGKQQLSWEIRTSIALGIGRAMEYLHSTGLETTHGNISSSNVLITDYYYKPYLSDYGLTQLVSSTPNLNGYKAPEVSDVRSVSQQSDVYSFGVLLAELISGKEPERLLAEEGIELSRWVRSFDEGKRASEVIERELLVVGRLRDFEAGVAKLLDVAISCTSQRPEDRGSMADAVQHILESS